MGHAASKARRCQSLQKVFSNEVAEETRSLGEDEPSGQRNDAGFWYSGRPMKVFGAVLVQSMKMQGAGVAVELESALE
jgi:hypothetical protein